jgi:predicted metal-binding membrane protein
VPVFLASYLAVWALVGVAVYAAYRPHGTLTAGVAAIVAGAYELTPLKRHFRRCGASGVRSGFEYGRYCVGSSLALMLLLVAVGVMSVGWMAAIAALGVTQKLRPPDPAVDVPVAIALVALGVLIVVAPAAVPGLTPSM